MYIFNRITLSCNVFYDIRTIVLRCHYEILLVVSVTSRLCAVSVMFPMFSSVVFTRFSFTPYSVLIYSLLLTPYSLLLTPYSLLCSHLSRLIRRPFVCSQKIVP